MAMCMLQIMVITEYNAFKQFVKCLYMLAVLNFLMIYKLIDRKQPVLTLGVTGYAERLFINVFSECNSLLC